VGGYDMNRAWPSMWMPNHVQSGAGPYPLYWPETRCIARFVLEHPNIAGVQSYHNAGGMILRGPGAEVFGEYPRDDVRVYDEIGREGERMLPFYRYMIIWRDLYSVFGGFVTWTYESLGVISFTNELWNGDQLGATSGERGAGRAERHLLDDTLLFGAGFVDWHEVEHPLYGTVEVGGFKKDVGRVPPTFLIEEMLHRNALFALRHAEAMPRVVLAEPEVSALGDGLWAVDVVVRNEHLIPTRTARAAEVRAGRADRLVLEGEGLEVLAGGWREDRWRPERLDLAEREPAALPLEQGVPGRGERRARWLVSGRGAFRVRFEAEKARNAAVDGRLE
ncbi:MAG TPA: M14 family zinc carboxypeptidase, partial [Planctomycetota bacterium]|nr:M14 family zinc carboxypeptidase [Planctomycetota bacterium]